MIPHKSRAPAERRHFVNAKSQAKMVKFHWKPKPGIHSTIWDETVKSSGTDPAYHRRDLYEPIQAGQFFVL